MYDTNFIKRLLQEHQVDIAFIIGNGINRYYQNDTISWEALLLELWNQFSSKELQQQHISQGISFTEFYDAIEIHNFQKDNFSAELQKVVKEIMMPWQPDKQQNTIIDAIQQLNAPILTTNFEDLIAKSAQLNFYKMDRKGFTDYYPWSCYYSTEELENPLSGFGVWHMNGMIKYHRSIKLGLSQYMGNVDRARRLIQNKHEHLLFNNQYKWDGFYTWLHLFFNKSLFIFGLGLEENEVFIRWLLIERAKYYKRYPERKKEGWYITTKKTDDHNLTGQEFFLTSVGIQVLEVENYDVIYNDIWSF